VLLLPLAAAGSMTLTLYCGHVLTMASPIRPFGPGALLAVQVLGVVGFALLWRLIGSRGPLESVVAKLVDLARRARRELDRLRRGERRPG
jgi:hypothetical protein